MTTAFGWFMRQGIQVGGPGNAWFWIPFVALGAGCTWAYVRARPILPWKLSLLALLPLIWISVGVWGGHFWLNWEKTPFVKNPDWVIYPVKFGIWAFLAIAAGLMVYLREAWLFVLLFIGVNLYFMLSMTLLAGMAVTGTWL
jgi:hypothetical protein